MTNRLRVFKSLSHAREYGHSAASQGATFQTHNLRLIEQDGSTTYLGTANTPEECHRYAGMEFEAIEYHCQVPSECAQLLEQRVRALAA